MEMNIAVCDDQPEVLDVVENMLREIPEVERVETYQDIRHMRNEFEDGKRPDVLIMDICHEYNTKIPETEERQEGIDYAYELNQKFPELQIIYLTGYTTRYSQHIFLKPVNLVGYLTQKNDGPRKMKSGLRSCAGTSSRSFISMRSGIWRAAPTGP